MYRSVHSSRRRLAWAPALAVAAAAGILAGCSSSPTAAITTTTSSSVVTTTTAVTPTTEPVTTTTAGGSSQAIAAAWVSEVNAFYEASELDEPSYEPLLRDWVTDGPVARHADSYLVTQAAMGVVGPSTWRIGEVRVVSVSGATAHVEGCSYDPGSHYKNGATAPADLGGGAGYTGYSTVMELVSGRWLVDSTVVTAPSSSKVAGPCHGF